jgi:mono/diheme cytochrome c family protein/rhodanese-related sulfurtransferase
MRSVALAIMLLTVGCGRAEVGPGEPPPPAPPVDQEAAGRGRALYATYCALCHGAGGEGYVADNAPALANTDFLDAASDEYLRVAIEDGRTGTPMSAWTSARGGPLNDGDIRDIIAFMRSWATTAPIDLTHVSVSGRRELGERIYAERCVACHGARGEGVTAPQLANPVFQRTATVGYVRYVIDHGRRGTPMPAFGDTLDSASVDDVVSFVRTLGTGASTPEIPTGGPAPDIDHLVMNPNGPDPGFEMRDDRFVAGRAVYEAMGRNARMVILDARAPTDWAHSHVRGAAPFPFYDVEALASHLPSDGTWIIAYCACPHAASGHVVDELRRRGFTHAAILDEGIPWWITQGYPVESGPIPTAAPSPTAPSITVVHGALP